MKLSKKLISIVLAIVMLVTSCSIAFFAYAVDDFGEGYDLQIYYSNENKEFVEVTEQLPVMEQYDIQLYACLVYEDGTIWNITNSGMPVALEGYTLDWTSDARYLAFCENNDGKIHGYDATKGEAIRNWLDNEIGSIPVVGNALKNAILKLIDNGVTDIDNLDTEDVTKILDKALESVNIDEETRAKLTSSLKEYLDKFDVGITATLKDADGKTVDSDTVRVLVTKSDKLLSDVIPNAAFIKNYDTIPRTVAVGYEMDLDGIITPVRTHYKCEWTVTGQAGILGSDLAEVDENGHFTAKSVGKVQVKVSPDIKGLTQKLKDAFEAMSKAGDLVDSDTIAKAILLILGIPANSDNYTTLVSIISRIVDSGVIDADGTLRFTDEIMTPLANFILYVIYQDSVTIEIVAQDAIPITSYNIEYTDELTEGETTQLKFVDVKPDGAVAHDYKLSIDNEEYAVFTDKLTVMGIDGSTWNANYVTPNKPNIICDMEGIKNSYELKVYGKGNKNVVYIKINCLEYLEIGVPTPVNAVTYPKRLDSSLQYGWVMSDGTYRFATADTPAYTEDGLTYVTSDGVLYSTGCTVNDLIVKEANGATQTKQIMSGIQTTGVSFTKKHFWKKCDSGNISTGIRGTVCEISACLTPADASFKELTFTSKDTESVILSAKPLTSVEYYREALTEARRASHATVTVTADEDGYATVYSYAIGNTACYADITVSSQTGGFVDEGTVAFANMDVTSVDIYSYQDEDYLIDDNFYQITAGDQIDFFAKVRFSEAGSWKNQAFEGVEWKVSDDELATISSAGVFIGRDVGTVTVTATSMFGEVDGTVQVKILPDYRALKAAIADCDYENLDPYDWSEASWEIFDSYYKDAVNKLENNLFSSQREVDELTENLKSSFAGLVRYLPITGISLYCANDADGNGFATIDVAALVDYTKYSTTIVPTVYPEEAEYYTITYKSSDESKLRVNNDGVCTPVSSSDAAWAKVTVTVTDPKNGNSFSQDMYVAFAKYQVVSVTVDPTSLRFVGIGEDAEIANAQISATYNTSSKVTTASIKYGFFVSSDNSVATVDANSGVVTPTGIGHCIITCYSYDGGYTGVTDVVVTTNKNKLKSAIDKANALVEEFYTEDSYAAVQTVLVDANAVYINDSATQQEINKITATLNTALDSLVRNPYANVYVSADAGGAVMHDNVLYKGYDNKVRVLIEDGLSVTAVADDGYHFTRWVDANGNTISTNESETFAIDYSAYFKAEFEKVYSPTAVKIFVDGNDAEYFTKDYSALANYTKDSVQLSYTISPANANFYTVEYNTTSTAVTLNQDGKLTPAENNTCYAIVDVVVTNTITGERLVDSVTVAFVKYKVASVSASPKDMSFEGVNADNQTITINYSAASSNQTPSLRRGFFVSSNPAIADVDVNGNVIPHGIGTCTITFTAYDGGYTDTVSVAVYADKSALRSAITFANNVVKRNYTEDSYSAMMTALESANAVDAVVFASQQDVDSATSSLQQAINNLVKLDLVEFDLEISGSGYVVVGDNSYTSSSSITVKAGSDLKFIAVADTDNEFVGWYDNFGNLISSDSIYNVIAGDTAYAKARFVELVYVDSVNITYNNNVVDFVPVTVSTLRAYTAYSVKLDCAVNPSNASHYTYNFALGSDCVNMKLEGSTVTPDSNNAAYGTVYVTVLDQSNGKTFTDSVIVSFANYPVSSVSLDKSYINLQGASAPAQTVNVTYTSSSRKATIQKGFVSVDNEDVVTVAMQGDSTIVVTPKAIGIATATFKSYDGGHVATLTIDVTADKSALNQALAEISALNPEDYTEDTFVAVQPVAEYAQGVYDLKYASQQEVDDAVSAVRSVMSSLVARDVLTVKATSIANGYVTINGERISSIRVNRGDVINIEAVADEGYLLEAWYDENGNIVSTNPSYFTNYIVDGSLSIIAVFKPIPYIERVVATSDGNEVDFVTVTPGIRYTGSSVTLNCKVYPEDANYTVIGYSFGTPVNNLTLNGSTVTPSSNNPGYGEIVVSVRDNYSGKIYTDTIYVGFARTRVSSVSVSPETLSFDSATAASQKITPSYKGATSVSKPNIQDGFFVSDDESVATVTRDGVVTPVGKGTCAITFYCYDDGKSAITEVKVSGAPDVYGKVVAMTNPNRDSGTVGVKGAIVTIDGKQATTDSDGSFKVSGVSANRTYNAIVTYKYGVTRNVTISVGDGDKQCKSIPIITVDYYNDGYINALDYLVMRDVGEDNKVAFDNFFSSTQYTSFFYKSLSL